MMKFEYFVIDGETAEKIKADFDAKMEVFQIQRSIWEEKYYPLLATPIPYYLLSKTQIKPSDFGLKKVNHNPMEEFYRFKDTTTHSNNKHYQMYSEYQELHKLLPRLKNIVMEFSKLNLSGLWQKGYEMHFPFVSFLNNIDKTIVVRIPCNKNIKQKCIDYPSDIHKLKESEWHALIEKELKQRFKK